MPDYRRYRVAGGTYVNTVNLLERFPDDLLVRHIDESTVEARYGRNDLPLDARLVLPDHLLPYGPWKLETMTVTNRWRLIKQEVAQSRWRDNAAHKSGRPSHTYHTYMIANLRLILEVEVQDGDQSSAAYSAPGLWALLGPNAAHGNKRCKAT